MQNTQTKDVQAAVQTVMDASPVPDRRNALDLQVGESIQQGDVYMHRVAPEHPRGKVTGSRQVAVGTTIGSRHIVVGELEVFQGSKLPQGFQRVEERIRDAYLGPVVVADAPFALTHPEHAHIDLPAGTYQVTFQLDYARQTRVAD